LKEGLDLLYALQLKDDLIRDIETLIREIPQRITALEEERDAKSLMVEQSRQKLMINADERKKMEKEIVLVREKIVKYKDQMKKVTTNKEYQNFISEIKYEEGNIARVEEKIIEKMIEADEIVERIRQTEAEYQKIASDYNQQIAQLQGNLQYEKRRQQEENKSKEELCGRIAASLLKVYRSLYAKKSGRAVSFVASEFCGACHVKIRPQVLNELVISNDILICENCGRILFKKIGAESDDHSLKAKQKESGG